MKLIAQNVRVKTCPLHGVPYFRVGYRGRKGECYICHRNRSRLRCREYRLRKSPDPEKLLKARRKKAREAKKKRRDT